MATVDKTYVDPSALLKLYLHEPESRAMSTWRTRARAPVMVTHHGRVELTNAIALAVYRKLIDERIFQAAMAAVEDDFETGRCLQADIPWRATFSRAAELSRRFSPTLGTRTLDILHVASAIELGFRHFLSFDERQLNLARAAGMRPFTPSAR